MSMPTITQIWLLLFGGIVGFWVCSLAIHKRLDRLKKDIDILASEIQYLKNLPPLSANLIPGLEREVRQICGLPPRDTYAAIFESLEKLPDDSPFKAGVLEALRGKEKP